MKSNNRTVRRGGAIAVATLSAAALAACSAGQITQTSSQVPAVDGARGGDESLGVSVQDVTVILDENTADAALKFTAQNQDPSGESYNLSSVTVDGQEVQFNNQPVTLEQNCRLVADYEEHSTHKNDFKDGCIQYATTSLENEDYAFGGNLPVVFTFDGLDPIEVTATVAAPTLVSGEQDRDYQN